MERTLLLVDDEENIIAALSRVLRREAYTILRAENGMKGLALLEQSPVGVIISDQRMPGMTGIQFLNEARRLSPETVRIVLSGYTDFSFITEAINQGEIYKFIAKPWNDERLRADLRKGFERYEMNMEHNRLARELQKAQEALSSLRGGFHSRIEGS